MSDDLDDDFDGYRKRPGVLAYVMPVIVAVVALGVGGAAGALGVYAWWQATPPEVEVERKVVMRDLTDAELETLCDPFVSDTLAVLTEAQQKVTQLEDRVTQKEAKVAELEQEMERRAEGGRRLVAELEAAKKELVTLREELDQAVEEKEEALAELEETVNELKATEDELETTQARLTVAQQDVLDNRWTGFVQDAQLEICEKGRRRKMGRCRDAVAAALDQEVQAQFRHCIRSGQAVPGFQEAPRKMETLPSYSFWLNQDERMLRRWFVTMCDPTLPEADDFVEALEQVQAQESGGAAGGPGGAIEDLLEEVGEE